MDSIKGPLQKFQTQQAQNAEMLNQIQSNDRTKNSSRFCDMKSRPSELPKVPLIRKSEITINFQQMHSKAQILADKNSKPQKSHFSQIENHHSPQYSETLHKNLFQRNDSGLFCNLSVKFEPDSQKSTENIICLPNPCPRENQQIDLSKYGQNMTDNLQQHSSHPSCTTIVDPDSQEEFLQNHFESLTKKLTQQAHQQALQIDGNNKIQQKIIQALNFTDNSKDSMKSKSKFQTKIRIPHKIVSPYKQALAFSPTSKIPKDFVVPIIINKDGNNKSKYNSNQYLNIQDQNLTNFFTTKERKSYIDHIISGTNTLRCSNVLKSQIHTPEQNYPKKISKLCFNQTQNSTMFRSSVQNDFNQKENSFYKEKWTDFQNLTISNTKFLVKTCPSQKNRKFFNQSISTLINYNFKPLTTGRKEPNTKLLQSKQQKLNQKKSKRILQSSHSSQKENYHILKDQKYNCDYWAQINSYKKMRYNSKKNKKLSDQEIQNSKFVQEIDIIKESEHNQQFEKDKGHLNYFYCDQNINIQRQGSNPSGFSAQQLKRSTVSRYKKSRIQEIEMVRKNNIIRIQKFQKSVISKLSIVAKMGVKLPHC